MDIKKKYISEENSKKLLETILLSIKSSENLRIVEDTKKKDKRDNEYHVISIRDINISNESSETKRTISSFNITIEKTHETRWFRTYPVFELIFECENSQRYERGYKISITSDQDVIKKIYDYLFDIEETRKRDETNETLKSIIGDISTTVEKRFKRDETIDEILN